MPPEVMRQSGLSVDLSPRAVQSQTIVGSPALAAETIIAQVSFPANAALALGIQLWGWAAFTVGTSGTACALRIRQTNVAGSVVATTGATTGGVVAAALCDMNVSGLDLAAVLPGQIYVLTLQVTAGAAVSTVSACQLFGLAV